MKVRRGGQEEEGGGGGREGGREGSPWTITRSLSGKALNKSQAERAGQTESYLGREK